MSQQSLRQEVIRQCRDIDAQVIDEFFTQLDADYFRLFTPSQIVTHLTLLAAVQDTHPVQVRIIPRSANSAEILLAAYDLFGEFSLIAGLMATFGLNIREGQVFSYHQGPGRTTPWGHTDGGKIIDVFTVEFAAARPFDQAAQEDFRAQLTALLRLLRQGQLQQARDLLNYQLIDALRLSQHDSPARLLPVDIGIDNAKSAVWTVVDITADDTPAFLYSLCNALAMRNMYIHRVTIRSHQGKVQDQLHLGWRRGGKIVSPDGQRELRLIVNVIKQFTHFLTSAPDPVKALRHFDQLMDRVAHDGSFNDTFPWLWEADNLKALATVLGSSDFLWEDFLRVQYATLLPVLKETTETGYRLDQAELANRLQHAWQTAPTLAVRKERLNAFKDREMFRIDMRHVLHPELPFGLFSEELTELAEVVLAGALDLAQKTLQHTYGAPRLRNGSPCAFAVFALGKFGGHELGYASDIEMLCAYAGQGSSSGPEPISVSEYAEKLVQQLRDCIVARRSGIFEIDLRLRPHGSHGPLATSVEAFRDYYRPGGQAAPFERQALIKLRWVAGDTTLGQQIEALRDAFVYSPEPFAIDAAVRLRQRQIDELIKPETVDTKYSRGGLVDIEYTVQYLQLLHGSNALALRTPNTLEAMQALHAAGHLSHTEYQALHAAYVFLRYLIDALRMVRGHARDLVLPPTESEEFTFLARRMGYWSEQRTPVHLAQEISHHMQQTAHIYQQRFGGDTT
jgi:glutamate-ammonia-ligase adenylyltransferase